VCARLASQLCAAFAVALKLGWLSDPPEFTAQLLQVLLYLAYNRRAHRELGVVTLSKVQNQKLLCASLLRTLREKKVS